MLKLNSEKEKLLVSEYGFIIKRPNTNYKTYEYHGIVILPISNPKYSGRVILQSFSRNLQDKLYDLIKNEVLIQVPNTAKQDKINKLKLQIKRLESQIKEMEESEDE